MILAYAMFLGVIVGVCVYFQQYGVSVGMGFVLVGFCAQSIVDAILGRIK